MFHLLKYYACLVCHLSFFKELWTAAWSQLHFINLTTIGCKIQLMPPRSQDSFKKKFTSLRVILSYCVNSWTFQLWIHLTKTLKTKIAIKQQQKNRVRVEHSYSKVFFFSMSYLSFYGPIVHKLNILITCENKPVWFDVFCLFLSDGQSVTSFKKEKNEFHFYFARISFPIVSCFVLEEKARCLVSIRSPIFFFTLMHWNSKPQWYSFFFFFWC